MPGAAPLYCLEDSDRELLISVLLGGTRYSALTTSLLAQSILTVQQVEDALKNEEAHRVGAAAAVAIAAAAAAPSTHSMEVSIVDAALPIEHSWDCPYIQQIFHGKLLVETVSYRFQDTVNIQ